MQPKKWLKPSAKLKIHFVGIGGIGMSGIAEVFLNQGYTVSGSDIASSETTKRLESMGATITLGHIGKNVEGMDVVVISSAVRPSNPEVVAAKQLRIPVIPRAEMLAELMRGKVGLAVAGSHGKTTTTSILATLFSEAGLDPTLVIGGRVDHFGGNAKLGKSDYVIAEADESDGSFLQLPLTFAIVTNIDNDHLDFFRSQEEIDRAFIQFVGKIPFYGLALICGDDPGVRRVQDQLTKPFLTYGRGAHCDYLLSNVKSREGKNGAIQTFTLKYRGEELGEFELHVPGEHNCLNATAALALAREMGVPLIDLKKGLVQYQGVRRRFETKYRNDQKGIWLVDDYGHHPAEIRATVATARQAWPGRLRVIFQPHRYSRTQLCLPEFIRAFDGVDELFLTPIYAASEDPIPGVDSQLLLDNVNLSPEKPKASSVVKDLDDAKAQILATAKAGDLILTLGAGSITHLSQQLAEALAARS